MQFSSCPETHSRIQRSASSALKIRVFKEFVVRMWLYLRRRWLLYVFDNMKWVPYLMRQPLMCSKVWQIVLYLTLWSCLILFCSKPRWKPLTLILMKERHFGVRLLMLTIAFAQWASDMLATNQVNIQRCLLKLWEKRMFSWQMSSTKGSEEESHKKEEILR